MKNPHCAWWEGKIFWASDKDILGSSLRYEGLNNFEIAVAFGLAMTYGSSCSKSAGWSVAGFFL